MKNALTGFAILMWAITSGSAHAVDGVMEINQTAAMAGGITPGDAPGFPATLSLRGAYRLTGNLTLPNENTTAIDATIDNVDLDLNGFVILGPVTCTGIPVTSCTPSGGTGVGIRGLDQVSVRNGTIRGMGNSGIVINSNGRIEDVDVVFSGGPVAIASGDRSVISGSSATSNFHDGISPGVYSLVEDSTSTGNGHFGINSSSFLRIVGCTVSQNLSPGSPLFGGFEGNTLTDNVGSNTFLPSDLNLGHNLCGNVLCP